MAVLDHADADNVNTQKLEAIIPLAVNALRAWSSSVKLASSRNAGASIYARVTAAGG
jgi:hypothetical protein